MLDQTCYPRANTTKVNAYNVVHGLVSIRYLNLISINWAVLTKDNWISQQKNAMKLQTLFHEVAHTVRWPIFLYIKKAISG